jgi:iron complex outermembrane receptor protein
MTRKQWVLAGVFGGTLVGGIAVDAQAQQPQSASAAAMLEEVTVTARRREENLQDLPLSVQAITADAMEAQGIYTIEQITEFVPNVVMTDDQRTNDTRMFVRGIGGGVSHPASVFGVGMYVDGHYLAGSLGAFMSTVDVERVEVLRGPQGTLFGKNTTGGAVSLVSAKPGPDFDSYITLRAAEFNQQDIRGMINAPITDNLWFRGNYAAETKDGYYTNSFNGEPMGGTDQSSMGLALRYLPSEQWTIDARLSLSYDRDENSGASCRAYPNTEMYRRLMNNPAGPAGTTTDPSTWVALPFNGPDGLPSTGDELTYSGPGPYADGAAAWGGGMRLDRVYPGFTVERLNQCETDSQAGGIYRGYNDRVNYSDIDNEMLSINAEWESDGALGPFESASVQLLGAHRYSSYNYAQDMDKGPGIIEHFGTVPRSSDGINRTTDEFEIIFNGQLSDRLNLTAGFYWLDDAGLVGGAHCLDKWLAAWDPNGVSGDPGPDNIPGTDDDPLGTINGMVDDTLTCTPDGGFFFERMPDFEGPGVSSSTLESRVTGESTALYAHAVYSLNEQWDLSIGARAMKDDRGQQTIEYDVVPNSCQHANPTGRPTTLTIECVPQLVLNRSTIATNGVFQNVADSFDDITPTISLTRHLNPGDRIESGILYGTMSKGYLTGAFNDEVSANAPGFNRETRAAIEALIPYGPEYVTNYEFGFKGTLFDGRLRLAADVFFMDYTDKQEEVEVDNADGRFGPVDSVSVTTNAADVEISGIELELRASPWDGGFVSLDLGTLDAKYSNFQIVNLDDPTGPKIDVSATAIQNRTPEWTLTGSVEHAFQLANGGTLTPQLGVYMQSDFEHRSGLNEGERHSLCHQDSYAKWRARVTYEPAQGAWQASLFGYNITDEEILYRCAPGRSGQWNLWHQAPAQWGAEFTMRFGEN